MVSVEVRGLDELIKKVRRKATNLDNRKKEFLKRLAEIGYNIADISFKNAHYDGDNDVECDTVWMSDDVIAITASGDAVLFIEFGSGAFFGYGHEKASEFGYGVSTWSESPEGKGHWNDTEGWYYEHGKQSWGNAPARGMYDASKEMRSRLLEIAREVFSSD